MVPVFRDFSGSEEPQELIDLDARNRFFMFFRVFLGEFQVKIHKQIKGH